MASETLKRAKLANSFYGVFQVYRQCKPSLALDTTKNQSTPEDVLVAIFIVEDKSRERAGSSFELALYFYFVFSLFINPPEPQLCASWDFVRKRRIYRGLVALVLVVSQLSCSCRAAGSRITTKSTDSALSQRCVPPPGCSALATSRSFQSQTVEISRRHCSYTLFWTPTLPGQRPDSTSYIRMVSLYGRRITSICHEVGGRWNKKKKREIQNPSFGDKSLGAEKKAPELPGLGNNKRNKIKSIK